MKKKLISVLLCAITVTTLLSGCGSKNATSEGNKEKGGGTLNVVTTGDGYVELFDKFKEDTGIKVEYLSMSSGEVLSQTEAAGGKPIADVWFGGGIDAFMSAKDKDLLAKADFEAFKDLAPEYKDADGYWFSKGITVVGFIVNNDIMKEKGLTAPKTWDDLINPQYQGEILMSNPAISGTNYAIVNALLQTKGEEAGWKYFEDLNANIPYYSERGSDPSTKTVAGEVGIGITYVDRSVTKLEEEQNVTVIYPEDGIPYVPEGVAIFKNAKNNENATKFVEWLYGDDENLVLLAKLDQKDGIKIVKPSVKGVELGFETSNLMEEDLSLFGSQREAILEKFNSLTGENANE